MRTLYVAAGGGGDAVGALLARRALGDTDERPPLVTTCAWERLRIDPVPGPRARTDFTGLGLVGGEPCEVLPTSGTIPAGRSVLPRLAETSGARIFLHDFEGGAIGLTGQLQRLAESLEVSQLVVIDVGGDVVARGTEANLRSPLADSLTLAAAVETEIPTSVTVLGPGADAELSTAEVSELLERLGARKVGYINSNDVFGLSPVLSWHPTEATAVVAAAASGTRGSVAMRRGREPVAVTDRTPQVWTISRPALASFPLARLLKGSATLSEAEEIVRLDSVNEIDFERVVTERVGANRRRESLAEVIADMQLVGATHITSRRLRDSVVAQHFLEDDSGRLTRSGLWSIDDLKQMRAGC